MDNTVFQASIYENGVWLRPSAKLEGREQEPSRGPAYREYGRHAVSSFKGKVIWRSEFSNASILRTWTTAVPPACLCLPLPAKRTWSSWGSVALGEAAPAVR